MTSTQVLRISVLIAASLLSSADAVVLCAKRSGKVVARDACRSRETTVLPGGVALAGPAGSQGATGAAGPTAQLPQLPGVVGVNSRDVTVRTEVTVREK